MLARAVGMPYHSASALPWVKVSPWHAPGENVGGCAGIERRNAAVEVILTKDIETLGARNEVVRVKDGYARNYLLPHNLAIPANKGNLRIRASHIEAAAEARQKRIEAAQEVAGLLHSKTFVILAKAGKEGKLFGSVTTQDIVGCVFAFTGVEIDRKMISLAQPIKNLGLYQINIKLTQGVTASIKIDVKPDEASSFEEVVAQEEATQEYVDEKITKERGDEAPPELIPVVVDEDGQPTEPTEPAEG